MLWILMVVTMTTRRAMVLLSATFYTHRDTCLGDISICFNGSASQVLSGGGHFASALLSDCTWDPHLSRYWLLIKIWHTLEKAISVSRRGSAETVGISSMRAEEWRQQVQAHLTVQMSNRWYQQRGKCRSLPFSCCGSMSTVYGWVAGTPSSHSQVKFLHFCLQKIDLIVHDLNVSSPSYYPIKIIIPPFWAARIFLLYLHTH